MQLMTLENMKDLLLQANDNGNKRRTIRCNTNIEKKIDEVSQLITTSSEEKLRMETTLTKHCHGETTKKQNWTSLSHNWKT